MTDDIVTRLRIENYPLLKFGNHQDWCTALGIMDEAADEIERLRRSLQLMSIDYRTQMAGIKMRCKCGGANDTK